MFMTVLRHVFVSITLKILNSTFIIFQTAFRIVCEQRETQLTNLYFSHILMTSYTN